MKIPTIFVGDILVSSSGSIALYDDRVYRAHNFIYTFVGQELKIDQLFRRKGGWLLHDECINRWFYVSEKMFAEKIIQHRS